MGRKLAARQAGLEVVGLLTEPSASVISHGYQGKKTTLAVYDFGGGTFDAAVMRIRDGLIQVVNHDGDNFLGGKLIDWDIVTQKLVPALTDQFNLPEFQRGKGAFQRRQIILSTTQDYML